MRTARRTFSGLRRSLATLRSSPGFDSYVSARGDFDVDPSLLGIGCNLIDSICIQGRHVRANEEALLVLCHELISRWSSGQSEISPGVMIDALAQAGLSSGVYTELAIPLVCSCLIDAIFDDLLKGAPTRHKGALETNLGVLRRLTDFDSESLVNLTTVDQLLRQDPSGIVRTMDPYSIRQLRHAVYRIADQWRVSEAKVADAALAIASRAAKGHESSIRAHVGYFLTDDARYELATELNLPIAAIRIEDEKTSYSKKQSIASCLGLFALSVALIGSCFFSMLALERQD